MAAGRAVLYRPHMDDRIAIIRRRLDLYRRYVAVGPDAAVIRLYRHLIEVNEAELREIEGTDVDQVRERRPRKPA